MVTEDNEGFEKGKGCVLREEGVMERGKILCVLEDERQGGEFVSIIVAYGLFIGGVIGGVHHLLKVVGKFAYIVQDNGQEGALEKTCFIECVEVTEAIQ
jgi:hypothetical protein